MAKVREVTELECGCELATRTVSRPPTAEDRRNNQITLLVITHPDKICEEHARG